MVPVFPKWQADAVENWQELWVKKSDGKVELSCATGAIFNYMPAVGITKLTADNVADVWRRIAIIEALRGSLVVDSKTQKPLFVTRTDIERHIGAETEGTNKTFKQFCAEIVSWGLSSDHKKLPSFIANGNATMLELFGIDIL